MTKAKPVRVTAILSADLYNRLAKESDESGVPMTVLIRRAVDRSLPAAKVRRVKEGTA